MRDTAGIDLEIGGIGRNGHIAFNEPIITVEDSLRMDVQKIINYNEFWVKGDKKSWVETVHNILFRHWNLREEPVITNYLENELSRVAIEVNPTNVHFLARELMSQKVTIYLDGLQPSDLDELNREADGLMKGFAFYRLSVEFKNSDVIFNSRTRAVELSIPTIIDNSRFFTNLGDIPLTALTIGLGTVLDAKKIIIAATGPAKQEAVYSALAEPESSEVSASVLQRHKNVTFVIDAAAARVYRESGAGKVLQAALKASDHAMNADQLAKPPIERTRSSVPLKDFIRNIFTPEQYDRLEFSFDDSFNLRFKDSIPSSRYKDELINLRTVLEEFIKNALETRKGRVKVIVRGNKILIQNNGDIPWEHIKEVLDDFIKEKILYVSRADDGSVGEIIHKDLAFIGSNGVEPADQKEIDDLILTPKGKGILFFNRKGISFAEDKNTEEANAGAGVYIAKISGDELDCKFRIADDGGVSGNVSIEIEFSDRSPFIFSDKAMNGQEHNYIRIAEDSNEGRELYERIVRSEEARKRHIKGLIDEIIKINPGTLKFANFDQEWKLREAIDPHRIFHGGLLRDEQGIYWILKKRGMAASGTSEKFKNVRERERFAYLLLQGKANFTEIRAVSTEKPRN